MSLESQIKDPRHCRNKRILQTMLSGIPLALGFGSSQNVGSLRLRGRCGLYRCHLLETIQPFIRGGAFGAPRSPQSAYTWPW